jgi:DNA mismatch repair protein MutS
VARLAGLPPGVVVRAQEILRNLERTEFDREGRPRLAHSDDAPAGPERQLPLFARVDDAVVEEVRKLDLDAMTPLDALALLAELQKRLKA